MQVKLAARYSISLQVVTQTPELPINFPSSVQFA